MSKPITDEIDQILHQLDGHIAKLIRDGANSYTPAFKVAKAQLQNLIKASRKQIANELNHIIHTDYAKYGDGQTVHVHEEAVVPISILSKFVTTLNSEEQYHCGNPICSKLHKTKELDAKCRAHASEDGVQG